MQAQGVNAGQGEDVLRKTQVEIDGKKKVLIMINDVSDKVRLE